MIKEIVKDEAILTQKSETVSMEEAQEIITDLLDTAQAHIDECVGLAAPQIGVNKKVIVIRNGHDSFVPMINPVVVRKIGKKFLNNEGCLSLEGTRSVERYPSVLVGYTDKNGKRVTKTFNGIYSIIIQHETDHLNGILI
jgi:peptide deformylase